MKRPVNTQGRRINHKLNTTSLPQAKTFKKSNKVWKKKRYMYILWTSDVENNSFIKNPLILLLICQMSLLNINLCCFLKAALCSWSVSHSRGLSFRSPLWRCLCLRCAAVMEHTPLLSQQVILLGAALMIGYIYFGEGGFLGIQNQCGLNMWPYISG